MCRSVVRWLNGSFDTIYVQECSRTKAAVSLFPAQSSDPIPAGCLMALHKATHSEEDVRVVLNLLVNISDELWIREELPAVHSSRQKP